MQNAEIELQDFRRTFAGNGPFRCVREVLCVLFICLQATVFAQALPDSLLLDRRFDQVSFLYTHNSYNVRGHHRLPNQNLTVRQQLDMGVRGLMLDVYVHHDEVMVYHGNRILGHRPLQDDLTAIKEFLETHPTAVLSIIFESHVPADVLADALTHAGLLPYLDVHAGAQPWATLRQMVAAQQRLVIFSEKDHGNPFPWLHHVWDFATENRYSNHSRKDFDTRFNRGDSTQSLFLLNHFITHRKFGVGMRDSALVANQSCNVLAHALNVWSEKGHFPNFVAVDFVDVGDAKAAVDALNARWDADLTADQSIIAHAVYDQAEGALVLKLNRPADAPFRVEIRDLKNCILLAEFQFSSDAHTTLRMPLLAPQDGEYSLELRMGTHWARVQFSVHG